uniref:Phosphatidylinositol-3-phosphatase myotubularin-1 n=1 Tax=Tanacetum cinerariifolium TaxID=118510 RepID=A0A6L2KY01_TANCI|nr:phosphatidylinositol-3-phosphatase myotubularin-1 [Tanacetum cinerariifolium]
MVHGISFTLVDTTEITENDAFAEKTDPTRLLWVLMWLSWLRSSHVHYNLFYDPTEHEGPLLPQAAALAPTLWPKFHLRWSSPSEAQAGEVEAECDSPEANSESKVVVALEIVRRNSGQMENGDGRHGRPVSRPRFPYSTPAPLFQTKAEQESRTRITYGGRSASIPVSSSSAKLPFLGVKSFDRRSAHPSRHPSVGSSFDSSAAVDGTVFQKNGKKRKMLEYFESMLCFFAVN